MRAHPHTSTSLRPPRSLPARLLRALLFLRRAISTIITETCRVLHCDRATVFMVDHVRNQLVVKVASGDVNIRIPTTAGIAGHVYTNDVTLNIPEAYEEPMFNRAIDDASGYRTKSIICLPVKDSDGKIVAVLQAINKLAEGESGDAVAFTIHDEMLVEHLASQVGIILRNTVLFEEVRESQRKVRSLLEIVRSLHSNMGTQSLVFTVTERTPALVGADRCTCFLVDKKRNELWSMHASVEIRIPLSAGLAGETATTGNVVNIPDAYADPRFNQDVDAASGYVTRNVLCMPIKDTGGDVIGVIQLINKIKGGDFFTEEDEMLIESFLGIAGPILQTSQLFSQQKEQLSEFARATQLAVSQHTSGEMAAQLQPAIEEGDEDEEEEDEDDDEE